MNANPSRNVSFEKLQSDLEALSGDVAKLVLELPSVVGEVRDKSLKSLRDQIHRMQQHINASLSQITAPGRAAARAAGNAAGNVRGAVAHEFKDVLSAHPLATLAVALGIGWLIGASLRR